MPVAAIVARRCNHHEAGIPDCFDGLHQRIGGVALLDGLAQRDIDHADALGGTVGEDEVKGCNHIGGDAAALGIEHAQRDQVSVIGQPDIGTKAGIAVAPVGGDDAGNVGAVAEGIAQGQVVVGPRLVAVQEVELIDMPA